MDSYTTKVTNIKGVYFCRIFYKGKPVVQARAGTREEIGPAFRDLMRTLDKCGGDKFTKASRHRKFKEGNKCLSVKHAWTR